MFTGVALARHTLRTALAQPLSASCLPRYYYFPVGRPCARSISASMHVPCRFAAHAQPLSASCLPRYYYFLIGRPYARGISASVYNRILTLKDSNTIRTQPISKLGVFTPSLDIGGEGGIRTPGTRERTTVFETAPFDHSGTSPDHHLNLNYGDFTH